MTENLEQIFELESAEKYNEAYHLYKKQISEINSDFQTWKYYFFFLWSMLEDVNGMFTEEIDLRTELEKELKNGMEKYAELADFNFIAGYAISIFPYEFGDYVDMEMKGNEMIEKAYKAEPANPIYEMVYLGSSIKDNNDQTLYKKACAKSQLLLKKEFTGKGLLNEYFNQVFNRDEKKASW
ncbi:hypothetical protein [Algoriphagus winogradskyi]|uniref:Uncharacterized protein n=1 Tax=Algoriphagus winogradskyi TaxID=237017 RepID=A0ABY1P038_9BACT|nr:hypothetical protein [Algoriphagus winogradskyi]SMP22449.1 hypothetical protein SAMN06265367_103440 [Algoriphagus winogradskyi]